VPVGTSVLATAGAGTTPNNISASFFTSARSHLDPLAKGATHIFRHLQFLAGGARNVDDIASHRDDFFFADGGENFLDQLDREVMPDSRFEQSRQDIYLAGRRHAPAENHPDTSKALISRVRESKMSSDASRRHRPVNPRLNRQNHSLANRSRAGLMRIGRFVGASSDAVTDGMGWLTG